MTPQQTMRPSTALVSEQYYWTRSLQLLDIPPPQSAYATVSLLRRAGAKTSRRSTVTCRAPERRRFVAGTPAGSRAGAALFSLQKRCKSRAELSCASLGRRCVASCCVRRSITHSARQPTDRRTIPCSDRSSIAGALQATSALSYRPTKAPSRIKALRTARIVSCDAGFFWFLKYLGMWVIEYLPVTV